MRRKIFSDVAMDGCCAGGAVGVKRAERFPSNSHYGISVRVEPDPPWRKDVVIEPWRDGFHPVRN